MSFLYSLVFLLYVQNFEFSKINLPRLMSALFGAQWPHSSLFNGLLTVHILGDGQYVIAEGGKC